MENYVSNQEIREQAGFQYKERSETPTGTADGSNVTFYTLNKPIVERRYGSTPVSADDIVVYVGEPLTAVIVSAINAVTGEIILVVAPATSTPVAVDYDWSNIDEAIIQIYADEAHDLVLSAIRDLYNLPLSETPNLIKLIEKKLAAGLLLDKEYSAGGEGTEDSRGRRWIKWAEDKLKAIASGDLLLLNSSGGILTQVSSEMSGWPNNTTKDASEDNAGGKIHFRIKKKF